MWGAIAQGAASLGSALISANSARDAASASSNLNTATMQFNREEAHANREWQERLANTAHQREVADLKAAGLNPILSGTGGAGATVGGGASASFSGGHDVGSHHISKGQMLSGAASALGTAIQQGLMDRSQRGLQAAQAIREASSARQADTQSDVNAAQLPLLAQNIKTQETQQALNSAEAARQLQEVDTSKAHAVAATAQAHASNSLAGLHSANRIHTETRNALDQIELYKRDFSKEIDKYLEPIGRASGPLLDAFGVLGIGSLLRNGPKALGNVFRNSARPILSGRNIKVGRPKHVPPEDHVFHLPRPDISGVYGTPHVR